MKTLAIIVNYHASGFIPEAVASVLNSPALGRVQIVIVDNSADIDEAQRLRNCFSHVPDVELLIASENLGFGGACNWAFSLCDSDMVLLLNPDAYLRDGCLPSLQKLLMSSDRIGAVGPQIFWDKRCEFLLPPSYPPLLHWIQPLLSIGTSSLGTNMISALWRRFAVYVWQSLKPVRVTGLSGGHVLLKTSAVRKAGGLFDPRFFLYYEDTDLCIRLRQCGYQLWVEPGAGVVHHYDQCDQKNWVKKRNLMMESYRLFMMKHCKGWKAIPHKLAKYFPCYSPPAINASVQFDKPFSIEIPASLKKGWLFEWSPNSNFIPAAGKFGAGSHFVFSPDNWQLLSPGQYFGRIGSPGYIRTQQQCFIWEKVSAERSCQQ